MENKNKIDEAIEQMRERQRIKDEGKNLTNTIWLHVKTNGKYRVVAYKGYKIEATGEPAVVYRCIEPPSNTTWIRPLAQFLDGRFKRILDEKEEG